MAVPFVYDVRLPDVYFRALRPFSWLSLQIFDVFPSSCVGSLSAQLQLAGGLPLGLIALALLTGVSWAWTSDCLRARHVVKPPLRRGLLLGVPASLVIGWLLVPGVSIAMLSIFDCQKFGVDDATGATRSYVTNHLKGLSCNSAEYDTARAWAWFFIVVWPVGLATNADRTPDLHSLHSRARALPLLD